MWEISKKDTGTAELELSLITTFPSSFLFQNEGDKAGRDHRKVINIVNKTITVKS